MLQKFHHVQRMYKRVAEVSMAGAPFKRGDNWWVRWQHPDRSLSPRERAQAAPVWSYDDGMKLKRWLEGEREDSPKVKNDAFDTDPAILWGVFRGGVIPDHVLNPNELTWGVYVERWLNSRDIIPKSRKKDKAHFNNHTNDWSELPLSAINRDLLDKKLEELATKPKLSGKNREKGLSHKTQASIRNLISNVLGSAYSEGKIKQNPFSMDIDRGLPRIKVSATDKAPRERTDEEIYIPPGEWRKILSAAADLDAACCKRGWVIKPELLHLYETQTVDILWVLMDTGCRISELHGLEVGHVKVMARNMAEPALPIYVQRRYDEHARPQRVLPKGDKKGRVPISRDLAQRLLKYAEGRPRDASLFPSPRRGDEGWTYCNWWKYRWRKVLERAECDYDLDEILNPAPHSIRHTSATWLYDTGLESRDVAKNHRHEKTSTTEMQYDKQSAALEERLRNAKASFPRPAGVAPALPALAPLTRRAFIASYVAKGIPVQDAAFLADYYGLNDATDESETA
jgi:integrase